MNNRTWLAIVCMLLFGKSFLFVYFDCKHVVTRSCCCTGVFGLLVMLHSMRISRAKQLDVSFCAVWSRCCNSLPPSFRQTISLHTIERYFRVFDVPLPSIDDGAEPGAGAGAGAGGTAAAAAAAGVRDGKVNVKTD